MEAIARAGRPGALTALTAIAAVDEAELGTVVRGLAERMQPGESDPPWLPEVGEARIVRAAVMREDIFDDGFTMFLEACHPSGERHAVGVYIDNNVGVMAKDILIADSIDTVAGVMQSNPEDDGHLRLEPVDPSHAAIEICAALGLTDITPVLPFRRISRRFGISLAINFCCDYVDGRPLRWSPVVVELFMASWVPRKVMADDGLLEALPVALDAWVRFAGRKREIPEWAIELTREAIPRWRQEMVSTASDPDAGGPAKQFFAAAQAAGIDLTDEEALNAFVAGWNARSTTQ